MSKKSKSKRSGRRDSGRDAASPQGDPATSIRKAGRAAAVVLLAVAGAIAAASLAQQSDEPAQTGAAEAAQPGARARRGEEPLPPRNPLNGERAYGYLKDICAIGRRVSGSPGMKQQQELVTKHFEALGGKVSRQEFTARDPRSGEQVPMANLIVTWHPERNERLLLCAHYDTRPFPDQDADPVKRRQGHFIGANDGGSGVAVMMELAHIMPQLAGRYGVDFVLFDGEELVYDGDRDPYFLGSEHFAREYVRQPPAHKYRWGVLMDMVGDADLQIYQERNSLSWPDTRPLVAQIWGLAQRMGVTEFIARPKYEIRDDHLALRNIARIPTCDVIDFDYPAWHTEADTPANCSPESLAKVGWVMYEWMKRAQ
jgi:hypothetical protein